MSKRITSRQIAELCGVKQQSVMEWVDRGKFPFHLDKHGRRFFLEAEVTPFIEAYNEKKHAAAESQNSLSISSSYNKARALKESYNARLARLQYENKLGELIKVSVVEKRIQELALLVRDSMLHIPNKISPELASMTDEKKINLFLDKTIREALVMISDGEFDKWRQKKLKTSQK